LPQKGLHPEGGRNACNSRDRACSCGAVALPGVEKELDALEARADGELWQLLMELNRELPRYAPLPEAVSAAAAKGSTELLGTFPRKAARGAAGGTGAVGGGVFRLLALATCASGADRKKLDVAEKLQRDILEHSAECVVLLDADGCVDFVSEAGRKAMGFEPERQLLGKGWKGWWLPEWRARLEDGLKRAFAGEAVRLDLALAEGGGNGEGFPRWNGGRPL
jgi:PAS domain-containing protein